jgi:hypothetical protein
MMNYKFGSSLGKTETDAHIYGMASAAADCFKALAPFFFFAALRNRVWSQAVAAALVWVVVTGYAFTSALGHAALNRFTTSGERVVASTSYKDTRAELKRAEDQLKWIPPVRPPSTVEAEINVLQADRRWLLTKECTDATAKASREFCQQYFKLSAEHASGQEAEKLRVKIAQLSAQAAKVTGAAVLGMADPQANVIARMTGLELETVQTSLMLFVALLIEIGSGFGMYVAFAYWRPNQSLHDEPRPTRTAAEAQVARKEEAQAPAKDEVPPASKPDPIWTTDPAAGADGDETASKPPAVRPFGDNDNKSSKPPAIMPPNDVQRFYQECVDGNVPASSYVTSSNLNEAYVLWCEREDRTPLPHPNFTTQFDQLKVQKHGIGGGVKYFGIALMPEVEREVEESKKLKKMEKKTARKRKTQQQQEAAVEQPRPAVDEASAAAHQLRAAADQMRGAVDRPEVAPDRANAA